MNGAQLKQQQKGKLNCLLGVFVIELDVLHKRWNTERPVFNNYRSISNRGSVRNPQKRERPDFNNYGSISNREEREARLQQLQQQRIILNPQKRKKPTCTRFGLINDLGELLNQQKREKCVFSSYTLNSRKD